MTDFKRLIDEVDGDFARAVLRSGRRSPPSDARKNQILAAVGVGLVIGTTSKFSMAAFSTWQKLALIGGVACVGVGGAMTYTHLTTPPSQAVVASVALADVGPASPAAPIADALPVVEPDEAPAVPPAIAASVSVPVQKTNTEGRPSRESSMKAELALLEQARTQLTSGSSSGALVVLRRYAERYPRGMLGLEAQVLRVEALAAAGRTSEAARLAERVLAHNPKSVVAARLRRFALKDH